MAKLQELPEEVADVTPTLLAELRLVRHADKPIKVLGLGDISRVLNVSSIKLSGAAKAKIEAAGGSVQEG